MRPGARLTDVGTIVGTVPYMAPEQIEGHEVDARTDIFSFGVVLYEMVCGRRPFAGDSRASLMAAIVAAEPPALSSLQPRTPASLERLILRCLAKDPDDRWQTARDLAAELRWIAEAGSGTSTAAPGLTRRPRRAALWGACRGRCADRRCVCGDGAVDVAQTGRRRISTGDIPQGVPCRPPDSPPMVRASSTAQAGRDSPTPHSSAARRAPMCATSSWRTRGSCRSPERATWPMLFGPQNITQGVRRAHAGAHSHGWWRTPRRAHRRRGRRLDSRNRCARRYPRPRGRPSLDR